jgi:hypothetical protein
MIAGNKNLSNQVFEVIDWAGRQGRVDQLIQAAVTTYPNEPQLRALAGEVGVPLPPATGAAGPGPAASAPQAAPPVALPPAVPIPPGPEIRLEGGLRRRLYDALVAAFETPAALDVLAQTYLGQKLAVITGGTNLAAQVYDLLNWTEARAELRALIVGARALAPDAAALRAFAAEVGLD